jgi:hypothetical protein
VLVGSVEKLMKVLGGRDETAGMIKAVQRRLQIETRHWVRVWHPQKRPPERAAIIDAIGLKNP